MTLNALRRQALTEIHVASELSGYDVAELEPESRSLYVRQAKRFVR